jgi:hypothetical protein
MFGTKTEPQTIHTRSEKKCHKAAGFDYHQLLSFASMHCSLWSPTYACGRLQVFPQPASFSVLLSGCALKTSAPPDSASGIPLSGRVHGGQQPVVGAHVYLFAAGTTGYGAASTSLLTSGTVGSDSLGQYVTTDANGSFTITGGDYTCISGTQLYVLATQGNPGIPGNQTNPNLALMAAVGQCPAAGDLQATVPFIFVNEVTTIGSVYALSGFMTDLAHVSSSGTPLARAGIAQAFATVNSLVNIAMGTALAVTPAGNGTVPQAEINSLANALASCVNSTGASSPPCTTLFTNAQSGGTVPTDTVTAALYIAQNPGSNVSSLASIPLPTSPFQPSLSSVPNDFTIALNFTGGGLSQPLSSYRRHRQCLGRQFIKRRPKSIQRQHGSRDIKLRLYRWRAGLHSRCCNRSFRKHLGIQLCPGWWRYL